jgi:hypothetical protein
LHHRAARALAAATDTRVAAKAAGPLATASADDRLITFASLLSRQVA